MLKIFKKLGIKITLAFGGLFVAVALIGCFFLYQISARSLIDSSHKNIRNINYAKTENIRSFLRSGKKEIEILSGGIVLRDFLNLPTDSSEYPVEKERVRKMLVHTENTLDLQELFILDKNGIILVSSDSTKEGLNRSFDSYFTKAKSETYLKDFYFSDIVKQYAYAIASPIKENENEEFLGIIVGRVNPKNLYSLLNSNFTLGLTTENILINSEQYFISASRFSGNEVILKNKFKADGAKDCFSKKKNLSDIKTYTDYRGIPVVGTNSYISEGNWCLITKTDVSEILAPSKELLNVIILTGLFAVLFFLLIGYILSRRIVKPIRLLEAGAKIIEAGNLDYKVGTLKEDEIGELSRAFDKMTSSIKKTHEEVNKKVKEQTIEILTKSNEIEQHQKNTLAILAEVKKEKEKSEMMVKDLEKFKLAVDNASENIVITDPNGIILYANKAVERITGYSPAELIGQKAGSKQNWGGLMEKQVYESLWYVIKTYKNTFVGGLKNRRKNGEEYIVYTTISPIMDEQKNILFFVCIERDVTEEKRQAEDIRKKKKEIEEHQKYTLAILAEVKKEKEKSEMMVKDLEKFKLAVDGSSDHIIITDPNGIVLYANKAVERITGYSPAELIGQKAGSKQNWGGLMEKQVYESLWYVIKTYKNTFVGGLKNRRKNGDRYDVFASISPILDKDKNVLFFVSVERDVTKEKEIDRAKTEFVSLASHQLRTPLSSVNWYAEMLLAGDAGAVNDEQKKYLEEIYSGNQRMVELVNSLLNVSRLDLGTFIVEPKPTDVTETAKSVLQELKGQITQKHLKISEVYTETMPPFHADQKLLRIVFQNLLSNAVKYTPDSGTVSLRVEIPSENGRFGGREKPKDSLIITVSDTGMGIPENQKDKIFTKLFRADNAQESETEGTGLGLYIIKSITDQSGGDIWFESRINEGTTFYVSFPLSGMKKKEGSKQLD